MAATPALPLSSERSSAADHEAISYLPGGNELCFGLEEDSFWFRHRSACITAIVRRFPPPGVIYDVGGGNGFVARHLIDAGFATTVVEPGEAGARNARARGVENVVCATLNKGEFPSGTLPAVGLFDVLEHISNETVFLAEVRRCLSPHGRLFLTVPAYSWLWSDDDAAAGHARRYTLASAHRTLRGAGFRPLYSSYFFSLLPAAIFAARTLPSCGGRRALPRHNYPALHRPRLSPLLERVWALELQRIAAGKVIPLGSSCLLVAEKL